MVLTLRFSRDRKPVIGNVDGHAIERTQLVKTIKWWVTESERRAAAEKRAVFDLEIDNMQHRTVEELAQVIREFNDAAKEAGSPEKVLLLVSIHGLKQGNIKDE
jgi:hypothetical protein